MKDDSKIKILLDTSVLIDFFIDNEPFSSYAKKIFFLCHQKDITAYVTATSIIQLFYALENKINLSDRKEILRLLAEMFFIINIEKQNILNVANNNDFSDLLQNIQINIAQEKNIDCIISTNLAGIASTGNIEIFEKQNKNQRIDSYIYEKSEPLKLSSGQFINLYEKTFTHGKNKKNSYTTDVWQERFRASAYGI